MAGSIKPRLRLSEPNAHRDIDPTAGRNRKRARFKNVVRVCWELFADGQVYEWNHEYAVYCKYIGWPT